MVRSADGSDITKKAIKRMKKLNDILDEIFDDAVDAYAGKTEPTDISLRSALDESSWVVGNTLDSALEWFILDFEYGEVAEKISVKYSCAEEFTWADFGEQEFQVNDSRGMYEIVKTLADQLKPDCVLTSQIVKCIRQDDQHVHVETVNGSFKAKQVIVTASVGVLQSDLIRFEPELPDWKRRAINDIKMTSYTKVFVKWERKWWDNQFLHTLLVPSEDYVGIKWQLASLVSFDDSDPRSNMLCMTVVGEDARKVQLMTDQQIS